MLAYIMVNKQAFKGSRQVSWPSLQYRKRTDDVAGKGDVIGRHPHRLTGVTVPWLDTQVRYFIFPLLCLFCDESMGIHGKVNRTSHPRFS